MDGNGRWAQSRDLPRIEGHRRGADVVENIITHAREMGLRYLTLYAFSKENWSRPADEVSALMSLLKTFLLGKKEKMLKNRIRLNTIGDTPMLPGDVREILELVMQETACGDQMTLTLALSYGSRDEIVRGIKKLVKQSLKEGRLPDDFGEESFSHCLDTASLPEPDLIIRTSGEHRMSNFLLWQGAYAEYVFEECYWPDFTEDHFEKALVEYQNRERRFGKVSGQLG